MKIKMNELIAAILITAMMVVPAGMAEETVSAILNAGTAQAFTDETVSEEDLNTILECGLSAAGAINQQPWYFVALSNQEIMEEISGSMSFEGMHKGEKPENARTPDEAELPEGKELPEDMPAHDEKPERKAMPGDSGKVGLGDSPVAIVIYKDPAASSTNADFECGLACQNMVIAANALGYGAKIVSSSAMALNGDNHDALCEKLGVDTSFSAVAVLLIGRTDSEADAGASVQSTMDEKVSFAE